MTDLTADCFPTDFVAARAAFLESCETAGLSARAYPHPLAGPAGVELATDVVRIGPERAAKLLVVVSGVHGVELSLRRCRGLLEHGQ